MDLHAARADGRQAVVLLLFEILVENDPHRDTALGGLREKARDRRIDEFVYGHIERLGGRADQVIDRGEPLVGLNDEG